MANNNNKVFVFVLIVVAALFAHSAGIITIPGLQSAGGPGAAVAEADQTGTLCLHDGAVMTVGPAQKRYAPTTSVTSEYHRVVIDNVDRGLKVDGTTIDVATPTRIGGTDGSKIGLFYAENSSTYYANKQEFSVPCVNAFSSGARPDSDAYKLIQMASSSDITVTVFNDDDGLKNAASTSNESIAASDSANLDIKINWASKKGYSPFGKVYATFLYNTTVFDDLTLSSNDKVVSVGTTPTFRVSGNATTGKAFKTFTFPGYDSLTTVVTNFNLYIESTTTDPTSDAYATGGANIKFWLDDEDWYRNSETGLMEYAAENDTNDNVGEDASEIVTTIYID